MPTIAIPAAIYALIMFATSAVFTGIARSSRQEPAKSSR